MAITFNGQTLGDVASDCFDSPRDFTLSVADQKQTEPLVRGAQPFHRSRGNSLYDVSFTIHREHASLAAAQAYIVSVAENTRGTGAFSGMGLTLAQATCDITSSRTRGAVSIVTYQITGVKSATP